MATGIETVLHRLRQEQAPARRKSRTEGAAGINIIVQVIERGLSGADFVKRIIGVAIPVEIGTPPQIIAAGNGRPIGAADIRRSQQIIDRRLTRVGIKECIVIFSIPIKIRHPAVSHKIWTNRRSGVFRELRSAASVV
jgi:hypothetical protein